MFVDPCLPPLRPASYKGASFYVESDTGAYGRRIVTHEYPMTDTPFYEDLGAKFESFSVKGYIYGATAEAQKMAIKAACTSRGAGMLTLPAEAPFMARCMSVSIQRSRDKMGWFELSFEFRKDNSIGAAPFGIPLFDRLIAGLSGSSVLPFANMIGLAFTAVNVLQFVTSNATRRLESFATNVMGVVERYPMAATAASNINQAAVGLFADAERIVVEAAIDPAPPETMVSTIATVLNELGDALSPEYALEVMREFATFNVLEAPAASVSVSDVADAENARVFNTMVRSLGLMEFARAAANTSFRTRQQAIQYRADIVELVNQQVNLLGTDEDAIRVLIQARDYGVQALTEQITTLVPVVEIQAPRSMPSLYWAYRLYKDPTRAQELIDRNAVRHPSYIPTRFEALAS